MAEFIDLEGARVFLNKARDEFLSKTDAANIIEEIQTQRLTEFLESEGWYLDGNAATYGKLYKNFTPRIKIGYKKLNEGNWSNFLQQVENFQKYYQTEENQFRIPYSAYCYYSVSGDKPEAPTYIFGAGYEFSFYYSDRKFWTALESSNITIRPQANNATISCFNQVESNFIRLENYTTTVTDTVQGGNTTLTLTNGDTVSTILLEDVDSGTVNFKIEDYSASYVIGSGFSDYVANTDSGVTLSAATGVKTIVNLADNVSIKGVYNNSNTIFSAGDNVSIYGNRGDDVIDITESSGGNLLIFDTLSGTDSVLGIHSNDTIKITGAGDDFETAISSISAFGGYYTFKISSSRSIAVAVENHTSKSFYLQFNNGTPASFTTPVIVYAADSTPVTLTSADNDAIVSGNYTANTIINNGASRVSIYGGGGADSINVKAAAGSNNTIYAGTGEDTIILEQAGQIIQYKTVDDNDTIFGWQDDDTLQLLDTTSYSTVMSGKNFGIKVGDYVITLYKDTNYTNLVAGVDVVKVLDSNGTLETITVPKLIGGTSDADSINNADSNYSIYAGGGDDTISNTGSNVSIYGGSGADSVKTSGNNVTVIGVRGNDTVIASGGSNVSIDGGTGNDVISLAAGVSGATVNSGEGLDTIYSTSQNGNVFVHEQYGGNELILGFSVNDSIKLGAGVTPSLSNGDPIVKNSSEGTKLYLSDGTYIQMKGTKKAGATGNELSDFDIVPGGTNITIIQSDNTTVAATVPMTKYTGNTGNLFINADPNYTIIGSTAIENINNSGDNVTINTGRSNDNIINSGRNVSISAGSNDDVILIGDGYDRAGDSVSVGSNAQNNTIYGGAGNDTVYGNSTGGHVYQFKINEGTDDIYNFGASDTIVFVNSASLPSYAELDTDDTNFKDFQFTFGTGIITLKKLPVGRTVNYKLSQSQGAVTVTGGS